MKKGKMAKGYERTLGHSTLRWGDPRAKNSTTMPRENLQDGPVDCTYAPANLTGHGSPEEPELFCGAIADNPDRPQDGTWLIIRTGQSTSVNTNAVCLTLAPTDPKEQKACQKSLRGITSPNGEVRLKINGNGDIGFSTAIFGEVPGYAAGYLTSIIQNAPFTQEESFSSKLDTWAQKEVAGPEHLAEAATEPAVVYSAVAVVVLAFVVGATMIGKGLKRGRSNQTQSWHSTSSPPTATRSAKTSTEHGHIIIPASAATLKVTRLVRPHWKTEKEILDELREREKLAQDAMKEIPPDEWV